MKVVINKCYGGFGLSPVAIKRYLELCGKECHFYTSDRVNRTKYVPCSLEDAQETYFVYSFTRVLTPEEHVLVEKNYNQFTPEEKERSDKLWSEIHFYDHDIERNDPKLIQVVEELGKAANSNHAELEVIEIPDNISWEVDEYDGNERIVESHRSWS